MNPPSGKTGNRARLAAAAIACLLTLAACGRQNLTNQPPQAGDTAVATVDGQTVWASDVKREAAAQGLISEGDPLDASSALFHQALDEVIDQKLLAGEATRRNLANDPQTKRRLAAARERILGDMLVESMVEKTVSESSIRGLYDEELKLSKQADEFHARQIVLSNQADAQAVKKLLAAGGSFDTLAMQRSVDAATRFNGGDLGYFTIDVMPPAYADALRTAKTGDLIGPFQTDAGWVIMKVEDRRLEAPVSLEAARPQIVRFLTYNEVRDLLEKLRRRSQVRLLIPPPVKSSDAAPEPASAPTPLPAASASPPAQQPKKP
ncbi:MAG TPA: peptidylprolyl isomerase [Caulobacteraceae bacterium]